MESRMGSEQEIGLPKWPALVVVGDVISKEEAAEILIRTSGPYMSCNDKDWMVQVAAVMGYTMNEQGYGYDWESVEEVRKELQMIKLEYLGNDRIMSCWIGGSKGWCDWQGNIFSNNYNVGKWPTVEDIEKEWGLIAAAFPFLKLKSQLFDKESGEEGGKPVIQFDVEAGKVIVSRPKQPLMQPVSASLDGFIASALNGGVLEHERGCDIATLIKAIDITRGRLLAKN